MPDYNNTMNRNQKRGTGFTNLGRVIGANQNNALSGAVGGGIVRQTGDVRTGLQKGLTQFQEEANKKNLATGENKEYATQMINEPGDVSEEDVSKFETFRAGRYEGPTELQNQDVLKNRAAQAQSLAGLANTSGGRQALLQRFVGGAGYNQGQQRLDALLLGQSGTRDLNAAARQARGLGQQVGQATDAARQTALQIANQNRQFAEDVKSQLGQNLGNINTAAQQRMTDYNTLRERLLNEIQQSGKFEQGKDVNLTAEQYNALTKAGFDPNSYLYNTNIGDYVQRSDFNATLASALKQQEAQKAAALARLSGRDISETNKALALAAGDTKNIGTLEGQQAIKFNKDAFGQGLERAQEDLLRSYYNEVVAPAFTKSYSQAGAASADKFIDDIKRLGYMSAGPWAEKNANAYLDRQGGYNQQLMGGASGTYWGQSNPYLAEQQAIRNTGGDYATKSNLEKAIDTLRAGDITKKYVTPGQQGMYDWFGGGTLEWGADDPFLQGFAHYLSGKGSGTYADKFGRLRKIISPTLEAENAQTQAIASKIAEQQNRTGIG